MNWLKDMFRRKTPLPTPWQDPVESRRLSRQASWSELQARELARKGPPEFKPVVMTFQGPRETEARELAHSDDGKCTECGHAGITHLWDNEFRCQQCGAQFSR